MSEFIKDSLEFYDLLFGFGCNFFEMGKFKEVKNFLKRYVKFSNNIEFKEAVEDFIDFIESQEEFEKE